jgi:hypothetical protein
MNVQQMIASHPAMTGGINDALVRCIEECFNCAQACVSCADACLAEEMRGELVQCIRLNLDCADICAAVGAVASRRTGSNHDVMRRSLDLCAEACRYCAAECERHAEAHEHCRICADACHTCDAACRTAMQAVH